MSTQEFRSSSKWSAIRSKAVPSNLIRAAAQSVPGILGTTEAKRESKDKTAKLSKDKNVFPARLHNPAFAGSTGSSHL